MPNNPQLVTVWKEVYVIPCPRKSVLFVPYSRVVKFTILRFTSDPHPNLDFILCFMDVIENWMGIQEIGQELYVCVFTTDIVSWPQCSVCGLILSKRKPVIL